MAMVKTVLLAIQKLKVHSFAIKTPLNVDAIGCNDDYCTDWAIYFHWSKRQYPYLC